VYRTILLTEYLTSSIKSSSWGPLYVKFVTSKGYLVPVSTYHVNQTDGQTCSACGNKAWHTL